MDEAIAIPPPRGRTILQFLMIGLGLYLALCALSEVLVYRNGHDNPFFKIATADRTHYGWLILGASHAMPLAFDDAEAEIEMAAGVSILNLALQGVGPLYNDVVLERFARDHSASGLVYVVDSFAFRSAQWNEGRLADAELLARTPFDPGVARRLLAERIKGELPPETPLAYVTGFPKINNRDRFSIDLWESASLFDRRYRPSQTAAADRIAYLYPQGAGEQAVLERYLDVFTGLIERAESAGMRVLVVKLPLPRAFSDRIPGEADFDAALEDRLAARGLRLLDFSGQLQDARFYFDSDHLGRQGVEAFAAETLVRLLRLSDDVTSGAGQANE